MKGLTYILIVIAMLGTTSCGNDFLDVTPPNSLSDDTFWKSADDAEMALAGCYSDWETGMNILFLDAMSDNGYEQFDYGFRQKGNGEVTPANIILNTNTASAAHRPSSNWFNYERIRKYNNFLAKIEDISMDPDSKERYKAEVRFLRAYDYFNKVMLFGDMPLVTEVISPDEKFARTPSAEIKDFILQELNEISESLPVQNEIQSGGHVTRGAAMALKARLELYMEQYDDAMASAKTVIDMGVYELYPDYRELFLPESESANEEAILTIQYIPDEYANSYTKYLLPNMDNGWSALSATRSMVEAYETSSGRAIDEDPSYDPQHPFENRDPRLSMTIIYPGQRWNGRYYNSLDQQVPDGSGDMEENPDFHENAAASRGGQNVKKYVKPVPETEVQNYGGNIMVIRLAEMYLTFAEAAIETGTNTGLALQYINEIRTRAGHVAAKELTEELVRRERRVELAFEGLRYFDIKRWDLGPELMNGPVYGSREGSVNMRTGEVSWGDNYLNLEERSFFPERNYLLPIPQYEMDANPEMIQNPGY